MLALDGSDDQQTRTNGHTRQIGVLYGSLEGTLAPRGLRLSARTEASDNLLVQDGLVICQCLARALVIV